LHQVRPGPDPVIELNHDQPGNRWLHCEGSPELLFTENETNTRLLFGTETGGGYVKDGINDYVVRSAAQAVNPEHTGTKAAAHYQVTVGAGETVVVPAGVPHSEGNPGPGEIEGVVELRPALRAKEWHEALAGLVADGKTTPRGAPRNPLQLGATFWYFRHESRVTSPPIWVQNLMLPPLWALAKAFGIRPYYDHWDSRIPGAG